MVQARAGCVYEGKHYKVGEKINDYGNYGLQCGKWGITAWENYQDESHNQKTTKLSTSSTEPTTHKEEDMCIYGNKSYRVGSVIKDYGTYGLACGYWGIYAYESKYNRYT
ncbi:uncharacterized protein [Mytilus edulis]|uniref:uncharacterized protein isoform X3 n=1 Tax=Mytilus edulis TaxID=6550 RepID=UPI0039EE24ED